MKVSILLFVCAFLYGCCDSITTNDKLAAQKYSYHYCIKHEGWRSIHFRKYGFDFYCFDGAYGKYIPYNSLYNEKGRTK